MRNSPKVIFSCRSIGANPGSLLEQPPREGLLGLPVRSCCRRAHGYATFINGYDDGPFLLRAKRYADDYSGRTVTTVGGPPTFPRARPAHR